MFFLFIGKRVLPVYREKCQLGLIGILFFREIGSYFRIWIRIYFKNTYKKINAFFPLTRKLLFHFYHYLLRDTLASHSSLSTSVVP